MEIFDNSALVIGTREINEHGTIQQSVYGTRKITETSGDVAFYNFEKSTGCPEPWLPGPVCWGRMTKGNNGVY
jgi:hypothetical protein